MNAGSVSTGQEFIYGAFGVVVPWHWRVRVVIAIVEDGPEHSASSIELVLGQAMDRYERTSYLHYLLRM